MCRSCFATDVQYITTMVHGVTMAAFIVRNDLSTSSRVDGQQRLIRVPAMVEESRRSGTVMCIDSNSCLRNLQDG